MKARLLQTLFFAQVIFCSTFIVAAESNKDIRAASRAKHHVGFISANLGREAGC